MNKKKRKVKTHGMCGTRFYRIWTSILSRCCYKGHAGHRNYGGKGIKSEWLSFLDFKKDMYDSYEKHVQEYGERDTTIDRLDPGGNYSQSNCRWATRKQQRRENNCDIATATLNGVEVPYWRLAEMSKVNHETLYRRVKKYGWPIEKAMETPMMRKRTFNVDGKMVNISEAMRLTGLKKWRVYDLSDKFGKISTQGKKI